MKSRISRILSLALLTGFFATSFLVFSPSPSYAAKAPTVASLASSFCKLRFPQFGQFPGSTTNNNPDNALCINGFTQAVNTTSAVAPMAVFCNATGNTGTSINSCEVGWIQSLKTYKVVSAIDAIDYDCKKVKTALELYKHENFNYDSCEDGYLQASKASPGDKTTYCSYAGMDQVACQQGWDSKGGHDQQVTSDVSSFCGSSNAGVASCSQGVTGYKAGASESDTCDKLKGDAKKDCKRGYEASKQQAAVTAGTTSTGSSDSAPDLCQSVGIHDFFSFSWAVCPIMDGIQNMMQSMDKNTIEPLLSVGSTDGSSTPSQIFCTAGVKSKSCNGYNGAWNSMRKVALGLMVMAGLVILITQTLGIEVLDAYAVRKMLPRLLIAALGITLSWDLMRLFVEFTNGLGYGVQALIYGPFTQLDPSHFSIEALFKLFAAAGLATGAAVVGLFLLGWLGALLLMLTAGLAILIAFTTLVLRQILIVFLVILAPVAIVAYILPNTQKIFKLWWSFFSKALLMFPLFMAMIAIGHVFAKVAMEGDSSSQAVGFIAYFIPYFMLPLAFKMSGGALATMNSALNNRAGGTFDNLKKLRSKQRQKRTAEVADRAARGDFIRGADPNSRLGTINKRIATMAAIPSTPLGMNPRNWRGKVEATARGNHNVHGAEAWAKSPLGAAVRADDGLLKAGMHGDGSDKSAYDYLRANGKDHDEATRNMHTIRAFKDQVGGEVFQQQAPGALGGTGTGYAGQHGNLEMINDLWKASGGDMTTFKGLYAAAKGNAEKARRGDLATSFGTAIGAAETISKAGGLHLMSGEQQENLNNKLLEDAMVTNGPQTVVHSRKEGTERMADALVRKTERSTERRNKAFDENNLRAKNVAELQTRYDAIEKDSEASPDVKARLLQNTSEQLHQESTKLERSETEYADANREWVQTNATNAAVHDNLAGGPEASVKYISDRLMNATVTTASGEKQTVYDMFDGLRGDEIFNQSRRELNPSARYGQGLGQDPAQNTSGGTGTPGPTVTP